MKQALIGVCMFAAFGVAQAGTLEIISTTPSGFSGAQGGGSWDARATITDESKSEDPADSTVVSATIDNIAPVPEPQTYAMLLAGLGLLGLSVRRSKRGSFD